MEFRILGPLEVVAEGRPLGFGRRKQRAVLAILLVHANRVVGLDRLVEELWGEEPPTQAIGSLQAYVSHLRRLLEPGRSARTPARMPLSQPPGYRLLVAQQDLDASRFEALAGEGHRLLEVGEHQRAAATLAQGLRLWRGPVLADIPDASFAQAERARLEELRLVALEDRATAELALGRHATVAAELEQLVAAHPFREGLHGLRMLALYRSGRQAEALQAYQAASRTLQEELGIDPGPWLRRLEGQILQQSPELDRSGLTARIVTADLPQPVAVPAPAADGAGELVGRERQLAALEAALAEAAAGRGRLLLVSGEPGIGKTRLAEEVARRAAGGGAGVGWGRCAEEQGAPPFWPWVQLLRGLLAETPPERPEAVLDADGPELTMLLPELTEVVAGPPAAPVLDVEAVRFRLCQAVTGLLGRLATSRPLLLVIDDLHWADAASLRLLSILAGALGGARLLVVATYRDTDAEPGGLLADTLAALARQAPAARMVLGGLGSAEVGWPPPQPMPRLRRRPGPTARTSYPRPRTAERDTTDHRPPAATGLARARRCCEAGGRRRRPEGRASLIPSHLRAQELLGDAGRSGLTPAWRRLAGHVKPPSNKRQATSRMLWATELPTAKEVAHEHSRCAAVPGGKGHHRHQDRQAVRTPGRGLDAPRQPHQRLDPVRGPAPAGGLDLEPGLDRLVVAGPDRPVAGLHGRQPAAVPQALLHQALGLQRGVRRAHLGRPQDRRAPRPVQELAGGQRHLPVPDGRDGSAGLRAGRAGPAGRGHRAGDRPVRQGLVHRPHGPAVRGHEDPQPRVRRLGVLRQPASS